MIEGFHVILFVDNQMTNQYWSYSSGRKRYTYDTETIHAALSDIQQGKSLNRAAKEYAIPLKSLHLAMLKYGVKSKHQWKGQTMDSTFTVSNGNPVARNYSSVFSSNSNQDGSKSMPVHRKSNFH